MCMLQGGAERPASAWQCRTTASGHVAVHMAFEARLQLPGTHGTCRAPWPAAASSRACHLRVW